MNDKNIQQPAEEQKKELDNVLANSTDYVKLRNRKIGIKWMRRGTIRKITHAMHACKNEDEITAKCASLIILNNWWKIKLFHSVLWRMLYASYSDEELLNIVVAGKKKVDLQALQYLNATIFLTEMKDTTMMMTRAEAEHTLQGLRQGQALQSGKSTPN